VALVIDASVALAWSFADEDSPYANSIRESLTHDSVIVPAIWPLEVANGLLQSERRGRSTQADSALIQASLGSLPIAVDQPVPDQYSAATLDIARSYNLTVYDAAYLELAMREGLPLASLDSDLRAAAERAGVQLVT
jgi:predicted nucleic acid-binding protein